MAKKTTSWEAIVKLAQGLPDVEEGVAWGSPALKAKGQMLACVPTHKSAEPDSLAVRIDFDQREGLLADAPDVYYLKDHYVNYPVVLVRLSRIDPGALRDLLEGARRFVTAKRPARKRTR